MDWLRHQLRRGMNIRTYVLVGVLLAVLFWIQSLDSKQKTIRAKARGAVPAPVPAVPASSARRAVTASVSPGWGLDPFARRFSAAGEATARAAPRGPSQGGAPRASGLHLQGVMSGPLGRTALINGSTYREGERIGTREVLQIGRRSVMLLDQGTVTTLYLQGDE